jgi:hypothetical protein
VYKLTVTFTSGHSDIGTCDTFQELSKAIDAAMAAPGFVRYVVSPADDDDQGEDEPETSTADAARERLAGLANDGATTPGPSGGACASSTRQCTSSCHL